MERRRVGMGRMMGERRAGGHFVAVPNTCVCYAYAYHWSAYAKGAHTKLPIIQLFVRVC